MSYLDTDRTHIERLIAERGAEAFCADLAALRRWYFTWCRGLGALAASRDGAAEQLESLAARFRAHGLTGVGALAESLIGALKFRPLNGYETKMLDDAATRAITLVALKHQYRAAAPPSASRPKRLRRPWGRPAIDRNGSLAA